MGTPGYGCQFPKDDELITRNVVHDLGEYIATDIHNYAVFGLQNYSVIFKSKNQRPL